MALELSILDMELLLSFSTPVDAKDVTNSPAFTSDQSSLRSSDSFTKATTDEITKILLVDTAFSSENITSGNQKIINVELTDKNKITFETSYLAEVSFTRDDFNKKKDNYKVKGSVTVYKCRQCPYQNPKIQSIKEHLVNHRKYKNSIQCRYCDYYAPYGLSLQQHEVLHSDYTPSERDFKTEIEKKKFCPECPYKAVKNREIKCHQLNHAYKEGYLKCRYCNYYLMNTKGMKQHEVLHAADKTYSVYVEHSSRQQRKLFLENCPTKTLVSLQFHQQDQLEKQQNFLIDTQSQFGPPQKQQRQIDQNTQLTNNNEHFSGIYHQQLPQQQQFQNQAQQHQQIVIHSSPSIYSRIQSSNSIENQHDVQLNNCQIQTQLQLQSYQNHTNESQTRLTIAQHLNSNGIFKHKLLTTTNKLSEGPRKLSQQQNQQLSQSELSILKDSLKEKEINEKVETLNIADKTGNEFSINYIVKKISTSSNKYREKGSSTVYCCQLCPYTTKFSTHLREHLPHHRFYSKSVKCRYCNYYASNTLNLKQHEILHPQYEVSIPKKILTKKDRETTSAFKNESKRKRYKCKICPFDGQHPYLIVRHMKYHVYKEGFVKCKKCDYYLSTSNNMKQHELIHQIHEMREQKIEKISRKKKHYCKICPFRTTQKSHLGRHMNFHNKENFNIKNGYYTCQYCMYYSTNTGKMKQHEVLHTQQWEEVIDQVATAEFSDCESDKKSDKEKNKIYEIDEYETEDEDEDIAMNNEAIEMSEKAEREVIDEEFDEDDVQNKKDIVEDKLKKSD